MKTNKLTEAQRMRTLLDTLDMQEELDTWPTDVDEIFQTAKSEGYYRIEEYEHPMDNVEAMQMFLEQIPEEFILLDDETQVFLMNPKYDSVLQIDSGGGGDFHINVFDLTFLSPEESQEMLTRYRMA